LFWQPQVALFVNEATLAPVLVRFAPAVSVIGRFRHGLEAVLDAHGVPRSFIDAEVAHMGEHRLAPTKNRSVIGIMNEFAALAATFADHSDGVDLLSLSLRLSGTPCGPLYRRHVSPDRELRALVDHDRAHGRKD
jgi:hypothetical protein